MKATGEVVLAEGAALSAARPSSDGSMRPEALAVISVVLGAIGQLIVKAALLFWNDVSASAPAHHGLLLKALAGVFAGLLVYAGGTWFWVKAVARASISLLYPISACSYAVVAIGARSLFKENIEPLRWAGIAVITLGVAMLSVSNARGSK